MKKVVVRHFHEGNDADKAVRDGATYATQARVVSLETGDTLAEEWAWCSGKDVPSRSAGRFIAVGRLCKHHAEVVKDAVFGVLGYLRPEGIGAP